MDKENIILKQTNWNSQKDYSDLYSMMNTEDGIKEIFSDRQDRLMTTAISWLITANSNHIGFINLVEEKAEHNFLFLDMGIIKEYRGKGYGKKFLEEVKQIVEKEKDFPFILMETRKANDNANCIGKDIGCFLTEIEDRNIYLLQRSRLQEFIDANQMEELAKHFTKENDKRNMIKEYI